MFVVDLTHQPDPKKEIARLLDEHSAAIKKARKAIEKHDAEAEVAAWTERTAKALMKNPPSDDFAYLGFVVVHCPIATDQEGFYAELIVGSDSAFDPMVDDGSSYGEYDASELKGDYYVHHVPFLTTVARKLMDEEDGADAQGELEMGFAALCVDRLCRAEPELLLGGRASRRIFLGWNEAADLLGVVTKDGWKPKPLEADAPVWARKCER